MGEARTCGVCGAAIAAAFCPHCGAASESAATAQPAPVGYDTRAAAPAAGESTTLFQPRLLGEDGDPDLDAPTELGFLTPEGDPSQRIPLFGDSTTFGRHGTDVNLPDPALSSPHFKLERAAGAYFVSDLGSASGTFLNDRSVRSCELAPGDVIRAGTTRLTFRQEGAE